MDERAASVRSVRVQPWQRALLGALSWFLAVPAALAAPQLSIAPWGYQITQIQTVAGQQRTYDVTARAALVNAGDPATSVTARLTSAVPMVVVLDGEVHFGDVPRTRPLRPAISEDTFALRFTVPRLMSLRELLALVQSVQRGLAWEVSCSNCGATNRPPRADAGLPQSAYVAQLVTLDGAGSSDPDGDALSYAWSIVGQPAGSTAQLAGAASVNPTFTPDREGDYTIQLTVSDGQLVSGPDTVTVSTLNSAPVASAGPDRSAFVGERVVLDGSGSSDVDGDALTYAWSLVRTPTGSTAAIEEPDRPVAAFTPDVPGSYLIELVVDDGTATGAPDQMLISTLNSRPLAEAGPPLTGRVGETARLDGSGSSDADGDSLTYRWSLSEQPPASAAALDDPTSATPAFVIDRAGTFVAQLIVSDGQAESDPDTVTVSTGNSAPIAVAGVDQSVHFGATVRLDGAASSDPDGDGLTFAWALLSVPAGSTAALSDATALAPSFTADRPGTYVVQLIVNDGAVNSLADSLTVAAENDPPVARDDAATTSAGASVTIEVLANDSDADPEDTLRVEAVTQGANGAVTFSATDVTYTPVAGYSGTDSFTYRITDGAESAIANVTVSVEGDNAAPVADAGPDQSGYAGDTFLLDGGGSQDPEGAALSYRWALVSGPAGAQLLGETTSTARLSNTVAGTYLVTLIVNDGASDSAADQAQVSVAALPTLSTTDALAAEGDAGEEVIAFLVSLSAPIPRPVTVQYATADGAATSGSDYIAASGALTFPAGSTVAQILLVSINGDTDVEADEDFSVALSMPVNATLARSSARGTILNDDFSGPVDVDLDGVTDAIEDAAPNDGDGNGDGTRDALQSFVASLPNAADGRYVSLVTPPDTQLVNVRTPPNPSPTDTPSGLGFPFGFFEFEIRGVAAGAATQLSILLPAGAGPTSYWKYGPEPGDSAPHWYEFLLDDSDTGAQISSNVVTLDFIDGARGDDDLAGDGVIIDQGGPSSPTSGVIAVAGPDQEGLARLAMTLDGSSSRDNSGGAPPFFNWTVIDAPPDSLYRQPPANSIASQAIHQFFPDAYGTYVVRLTVTGSDGSQATDDLLLTVQPRARIVVLPRYPAQTSSPVLELGNGLQRAIPMQINSVIPNDTQRIGIDPLVTIATSTGTGALALSLDPTSSGLASVTTNVGGLPVYVQDVAAAVGDTHSLGVAAPGYIEAIVPVRIDPAGFVLTPGDTVRLLNNPTPDILFSVGVNRLDPLTLRSQPQAGPQLRTPISCPAAPCSYTPPQLTVSNPSVGSIINYAGDIPAGQQDTSAFFRLLNPGWTTISVTPGSTPYPIPAPAIRNDSRLVVNFDNTGVGSSSDVLAVSVVASSTSAVPGDLLTFTVTATEQINVLGAGALTDVNVYVKLPFGFALDSATATQGSFDANSLVWRIDTFATGTRAATLTVAAHANQVPGDTFVAEIAGVIDVAEGNQSNNQAVVNVLGPSIGLFPEDDFAVTPQGVEREVDVLANDTFLVSGAGSAVPPSGTILTIDAAPANGAAVVQSGRILYRPTAQFRGVDTLRYRLTNGLVSEVATLTMVVGNRL